MNCCDYQCDQGRDCPAHKYGYPTSRTFPRTLAEAWPQDTLRERLLEHEENETSTELLLILGACFVGGVIVGFLLSMVTR